MTYGQKCKLEPFNTKTLIPDRVKVFNIPLISDATSKEGINLEIEESTTQNQDYPVQMASEDPKIIIRKDIYDKAPNLNKNNEEETLDLPLYSPEQVYPSSPTKTVESVSSPHGECKNTELLKTSSPVPGKLTHPTYFAFILFVEPITIAQFKPRVFLIQR